MIDPDRQDPGGSEPPFAWGFDGFLAIPMLAGVGILGSIVCLLIGNAVASVLCVLVLASALLLRRICMIHKTVTDAADILIEQQHQTVSVLSRRVKSANKAGPNRTTKPTVGE